MAGPGREVAGRALREQSRYKADEEVEERKRRFSVNRYWLFAAANPSIGGLVIGKRLLESFARRMKTDFPPGRSGGSSQLADGVEDDFELGVIFVFPAPQACGASSALDRSISRKRTNVRMMAMLTRSFLNRSVASPCDQYSLSNGVPHVVLTCTARELRRTLRASRRPAR